MSGISVSELVKRAKGEDRSLREYALNNAFADMGAYGLDGLKKHLTSNALKIVNGMESVANRPEVSLGEVMKGTETSKAIICFDYQDKMTGSIELSMIKEGDIWKIDSLAMPKFNKFTLPLPGEEQSAE